MYIYNYDFLFKTNIKNLTSIKFIKSNNHFKYIDPNTRCLIIEYTSGMKYSDLKFSGFNELSDNKIEDNSYKINKADIIINGLKYIVNSNINFISCIILDGDRMKIPSNILLQANSVFIVLNSLEIEKWSIDDYVEFINSMNFIKVEIINKDNFSFSNFESVDTRYSINEIYNNSQYKYYDWKFYIDESDIISSYIDFLKENFPEYDISPGVTDLSTQKQKTKILVYTAKLADGQSEFASRIIKHAKYGKIIQVKITVNWEFLTDDLKEYINFKNKLTINHELFSKTKFKLIKDDTDWWYTINWIPDLNSDIERSPQAKVLSDTLLYNMPFSCELIGWLVLENKDYPTILYPINRWYCDAWNLIGAFYDKSDPNVVFSLVGTSGEYNFIIKETKDGKLYLTKKQVDEIYNDEYFFEELDGKWNLYDKNGNIVDNIKIGPAKDTVVDPLQMPHGIYVFMPGVTRVYKSDNLIIELLKDSSGDLKYVINLNNYINSTCKFRK